MKRLRSSLIAVLFFACPAASAAQTQQPPAGQPPTQLPTPQHPTTQELAAPLPDPVAEGMLKRAIQLEPNSKTAHQLLGELYQQTGREEQAKREFAIADGLPGVVQ